MADAAPDRALSRALVLTGIGIVGFWLAFFTVGLAPKRPPPCYFAYEHAFPLPDLVLAAGLVLGGLGLAKGWAPARAVALASAGGLMFLGLVDFSFNVQNGVYASSLPDAVVNIAVNAWCVLLGAVAFVRLGAPRAPAARPL